MNLSRHPGTPGHRASGPGLVGGGATRRQFLRSVAGTGAVLGAGAALSGCAGPAAASADLVRFWTLFSGPDGVLLTELLDRVSADTGIPIDPVTLTWGAPYYTKLAMAASGGRAPELAVLHLSRLAGYAPGGLLDPWDLDVLEELGISLDDFPEAVTERLSYRDDVYAIPLDTHPFIMFFNTDIVEAAGLDAAALAAINTPEAFLEAGAAVQEASGDRGISWGMINDGSNIMRLFFTWYYQQGATMTLEPGQPPELDRDAALTSIEFIKEMLDTVGNPSADVPGALAEFQDARSGILLNGEWELNSLRESVPLDALPIPTLFGTPATFADSHSLVLPHQNVPDEARRQATHQVVASMLKQSLLWAEAGHVPSYTPVLDDPAYGELEIQSHYAQAGEQVVLEPSAWFTGSGSEFAARAGGALQTTFNGGATAEEALDQMLSEVERLLALPAPE